MNERAGERALLLELPRWMRSRAGQWCARNLPGGPWLWWRCMDAALERQANFEHMWARDMLLNALNKWASLGFEEEWREAIIREWCNWRNAAERLHRARERSAGRRLAIPLALAGMPMPEEDPRLFELLGMGKGEQPNG